MKKVIVLSLALFLCTGLAMAKDLSLEGSRPQIAPPNSSPVLSIQLTGRLEADSPTWNRAFNNDEGPSQNCDFFLNDSGQDGQYYEVFCITSTDENPVEIVVSSEFSELEDTVLLLYCTEWDVAQPLENAVFYADDGGETELYSAFWEHNNVVMTPGVEYWLLLSTYYPDDTGNFLINCSDNVIPCGTVDTEDKDWSSLKALYR